MQSFISLMYHNVTDAGARPTGLSPSVTCYFVDQETFGRQIAELCEIGRGLHWDSFRRFFSDSIASPDDGLPDRQRLVQITFDDGWAGSVELAGPILQAHRCQALLFVTTGLISRPDFVNPYDLQRLPAETFRVGSHAHTHRLLSRLAEREIREELHASKLMLEDIVGYEVDALSVPGGALDDRVHRIAAETGYRYLFTSAIQTNTAETGPLNVGRVAVKSRTTPASFRRYLQGHLTREQLGRRVVTISKSLLGSTIYERVRRRLLGEQENQLDMVDFTQPKNAEPTECVGG